MIWIELIGPSGVGKSYWYEKFMQKYPEYEPRKKVLDNIYATEAYRQFPLKVKLMFQIYRLNLYRVSNHFKHKLFNYFFKSFQRKSKSTFTNKVDDVIIKKYLEHIDALNEPQIIVLKKIHYFHDVLIRFKFYQHYLKENDIYIAEDGLMHLSSVFIKELQADKILVFEKNFDVMLQQRLERAKKKPTTFIEYLFNEEELKKYIEDYYKLYASKVDHIIQECGQEKVKKINLNTDDVLNEMYQFIKGI